MLYWNHPQSLTALANIKDRVIRTFGVDGFQLHFAQLSPQIRDTAESRKCSLIDALHLLLDDPVIQHKGSDFADLLCATTSEMLGSTVFSGSAIKPSPTIDLPARD